VTNLLKSVRLTVLLKDTSAGRYFLSQVSHLISVHFLVTCRAASLSELFVTVSVDVFVDVFIDVFVNVYAEVFVDVYLDLFFDINLDAFVDLQYIWMYF